MKLSDLLSAGIALYIGGSVKKLDVHADPRVSGTYALRASVVKENGKEAVLGFLIIGNCIEGGLRNADAETVSENLEEIELTVWPPKSGALRFT